MRILLTLILFTLTPVFAQQPKIAIVGLVHAHVWGHLGHILKNNNVQLVGIAEPNPALVAEAKKMGAADNLFYSDYRKMLADKKPDIVWAFVENNRHLEIAKACASRKINVMFEKPLAATYKEAAEIRDLARKNNIRVMTNYQMAWWPANYAAKAQIDSGQIGKVWRLRGIVGHGGPRLPRPAQPVFLRMAYRSSQKRWRRADGFRLLQRPLESLVSREAVVGLRDRNSSSPARVSEGGR